MRSLAAAVVAALALLVLAPAASATHSANVFSTDAATLARFEFNGNFQDVSGNGRHLAPIGSVPFVVSSYGSAAHFTANTQGLDWGAHAALVAHPVTVEMVVTQDASGGYRKLFSANDASDHGWYLLNGRVNSYPYGTLGPTIPVAQRVYLAFVSVSPSSFQVYVDGVAQGTLSSIPFPGPHAVFFRDDTATGRGEQFVGKVEAMRISSGSRSAGEIGEIQGHLDGSMPLPEVGTLALAAAGVAGVAGLAFLRRR